MSKGSSELAARRTKAGQLRNGSAFILPPSSFRILGIDPGSDTTGWGVVDAARGACKLVAFGTVRTSAKESFGKRLLLISDGINEVIANYQPDVCSIEEAFYAANVKTALKLGQVRGAIMVTAARAGLEIHEYAPRLVKKSVVGYGAAEKHQVGEMVRLLLNLVTVPTPHDAADALAIAICHLHHAGDPARAAGRASVAVGAIPAHDLLLRTSRRPKRLTATDLATSIRRRAAS